LSLVDAIHTLEYFNRKADELSSNSFVRSVRDTGHILVSIGGGAARSFPKGEPVRAFVLTFRFFIQNNEPISLHNMAELYESLNIDPDYKAQFREIRAAINQYLDTQDISYGGRDFTRGDVMRIFIYGALAHSTREAEYAPWAENDSVLAHFDYSFANTVLYVLKSIERIRKLNESVIRELQS
jgi:hypothetical protein